MALSTEVQARIQSNVSQALAWLFAAFRNPYTDLTPDLVEPMIDQAAQMAWTGGLLTCMVMPALKPANDDEFEEGLAYARKIATSAVEQLLRLEGPAPVAETRTHATNWVLVSRETGKFVCEPHGPLGDLSETADIFKAESFDTSGAALRFASENGLSLKDVFIESYRRHVLIRAYKS